MKNTASKLFVGALVLVSTSCFAHGEDKASATVSLNKMNVANNAIYEQDVLELRKLYANPRGQACITYSEALQYGSTADPRDQLSCETYQERTPYSLAEIVDPKAISIFKQATLKASCDEQEKRVDGRFIKRTPACAEYFSQVK